MEVDRKRVWFYRISAFVSGTSVMAVELAASRLLAPYFSSSLPVWAVIIGIIMAAMSVGNYLGGRLADRTAAKNSDAALYARMLVAALWIALIPLVGKYLIVALAAVAAVVAGDQVIIIGSLLSCLVLFVTPMVLLGMVSPFLVSRASSGAPDQGTITGSIYAWGTIGSILGTFLASFVTIPDAGVAKTFLFFAVTLAVLVLVRALTERRRWWPAAGIAAAGIVLLILPLGANYAFWESGVLHQDESAYNYLLVHEDDQARYLSTNVLFGVQSMLPTSYLNGTSNDMTAAQDTFFSGLVGGVGFLKDFEPNKPIDALMLGLGAGTSPTMLQQALPGSRCTGIEIDKKIADIAHDYFALTPEACNVVVGDGRSYMEQHPQQTYDLIMVDAYQDVSIPFYMATQEFFELCASRLNEGGAIACNVNMGTKNNAAVVDALASTMRSVFGEVYSYDIGGGATNTLLYAAPDTDLNQVKLNLAKCSMLDATGQPQGNEVLRRNLPL